MISESVRPAVCPCQLSRSPSSLSTYWVRSSVFFSVTNSSTEVKPAGRNTPFVDRGVLGIEDPAQGIACVDPPGLQQGRKREWIHRFLQCRRRGVFKHRRGWPSVSPARLFISKLGRSLADSRTIRYPLSRKWNGMLGMSAHCRHPSHQTDYRWTCPRRATREHQQHGKPPASGTANDTCPPCASITSLHDRQPQPRAVASLGALAVETHERPHHRVPMRA